MSFRDRPSQLGTRQPSSKWYLGAVLCSLCAHALLLNLPFALPSSDQPSTAKDSTPPNRPVSDSSATEVISIAQLPNQKPSPPPNPTQPAAQNSAILSSPAQPAAQSSQPLPEAIEQPASPPLTAIALEAIETPKAVETAVQQPDPALTPQPSPQTDAPQPSQPSSPTAASPAASSPTASSPAASSPAASQPEQGMVIALSEEFPHFADAQSGCFRLANCHRIAGQGSYRQAAKQLVKAMKATGYQVQARDDIDDQGHRVYEVIMPSEPEKTYYLNVFSDSADSMVYALTLQIVSLAELQQLAG